MFTLSQLFAIMHFKKDLKVSIYIADKLWDKVTSRAAWMFRGGFA